MKYKKGIMYRSNILSQHRLSTTISSKHWALLQKYAEKHGTQQKALEYALENLENKPQQPLKLSPEELLLLRLYGDNSFRAIASPAFLWLLATADFGLLKKLIDETKPMEYTLEFVYQRSLKDCSLTEVLDGLVLVSNMSKWWDTFNYSDDGDYYMVRMYHSMGINGSKMSQMILDSLFNTYVVKFESTISEKTVFFKIYKKGQEKQNLK